MNNDNIKKASVYKFKDHYIIHSENTTKIGYSIASEPYENLPIGVDSLKLITTLIRALNESKMNVTDDPKKDRSMEFLQRMGFKSLKELHTNSFCVSVHQKNHLITFVPTTNRGPVEGFRDHPSKKLEISEEESLEKKQMILLEALSKCD